MFEKYKEKDWRANLNYLLSEISEKTRDLFCMTQPVILFIDPSSVCNLHCPFCPRGNNTTKRPKKLLTMDTFNTIMDKFGDYCMQCHLNEIGEPLLNHNIADIVSGLNKRHISSMISSNMSFKMDVNAIDNLLLSGLDVINGSIDGASQQTYQKYRAGGSFQNAFENMSLFAARNRELGTKCHIFWQFLVFKHNENEIGEARKMANDIGVHIEFLPPSIPEPELDEWESTLEGFKRTNKDMAPDAISEKGDTYMNVGEITNCPWPWRGLTIQSTGDVSLCCLQFPSECDIGHISLSKCELWNGRRNIAARAFLNGYRIIDEHLPCKTCVMRNSHSCHPPRHIKEDGVINNGGIPSFIIHLYKEMIDMIKIDNMNFKIIFDELYQYSII